MKKVSIMHCDVEYFGFCDNFIKLNAHFFGECHAFQNLLLPIHTIKYVLPMYQTTVTECQLVVVTFWIYKEWQT